MKVLAAVFLSVLSACVTTEPVKPVPPVDGPKPTPAPQPVPAPKDPCAMVVEKQRLQHKVCGSDGKCERWEYIQDMPVTKPVAKEAHYLIAGLDPKSVTDQHTGVADHVNRTCELLKGKWAKWYPGQSSDCRQAYKNGRGSWTPAEGGGIGRGSTGKLYPSVECEAMSGNMYWGVGSAPKPGTRYIVKNPATGKAVVACFGWEAGPGNSKWGGGVVREVFAYVGGDHGTVLTLGKAVDQGLPFGPVECAK